MKTSLPINNFSFGQVDAELAGRIDLAFANSGGDIVENFYQSVGGNLFYRTGFEFMDTTTQVAIYEFRFNQEQSYLLAFDATNIEFWSYTSSGELVQVLSGASPLQVAHPYGADRFNLRVDQKGDVMYITHKSHDPRKLTRTSANAFTLATYEITGSTFPSGKKPYCCAFYEGRLIYAIDTTIYGSKTGSYDDITIGTGATDGFKFDIAEIKSPIFWLMATNNSLAAGTVDGIVAINGGSVNTSITPTSISAKLASKEGAYNVMPVVKDGYVLYISQDQRSIFAFSYDILSESFAAKRINKIAYDITKNKMSKIIYKHDKFNFIYILCGDDLLVLNFDGDEGSRGLIKLKSQCDFKDIVTVIKPNGDYDLFACTKFNADYHLQVLSNYVEFSKREETFSDNLIQDEETYQYLISEELKDVNFLDMSLKYDGYQDSDLTYTGAITIKSIGELECSTSAFTIGDINKIVSYKTITGEEKGYFKIIDYVTTTTVSVQTLSELSNISYSGWYLHDNEFSGLDHLEGQEVSIIGDGGYIGDFTVASGTVTTPDYYSKATIGLKYKGIFKSMNMGFQASTVNTQVTYKAIYKAVLRFVKSAGGKFGSSLYNLVPIQKFSTDGYYDLPPLPMDGDNEIVYNSDGFAKDKRVFVVQDEPLPLNVSMIVPFMKQVGD